jgi:hypothetical protein
MTPVLAPLGGLARLSLQPLSGMLRICCHSIELRLIHTFDPSRSLGPRFCSDAQRSSHLTIVVGCGRQPEGWAHEAAGHHRTNRWCGDVAARGTRAAADDAGDRLFERRHSR